jgi:type IV secretion system protein VirB9
MTAPYLRSRAVSALLMSVSLAGCAAASAKPPAISYDDAVPASRISVPSGPVEIVTVPTPLPLPGQLKPVPGAAPRVDRTDPTSRVGAANEAARIQPARDGFMNAIQQYPWSEGALYQLYSAPGQVTDIALQEGEQLVGAGPVAAGDTARWIIGDTVSGSGAAQRVHILVKPTRADLLTNLVINTDRRTYHLELRATASTYMASVSWTYPEDRLVALRGDNAAAAKAAPAATGVDLASLNFQYTLDGDTPPWRPVRVFDDGHQVFIEFPAGVAQGELPPLFVVGASGQGELVNYRIRDRYMVVDRLFAAAELRLGTKKGEARVRIVRNDGRRAGKGRR